MQSKNDNNINNLESSDSQRAVNRLAELLQNMNVPSARIQELTVSNVRWLGRNLAVHNSTHPQFEEAVELIVQLLKLDARNRTHEKTATIDIKNDEKPKSGPGLF